MRIDYFSVNSSQLPGILVASNYVKTILLYIVKRFLIETLSILEKLHKDPDMDLVY